MTALRKVLVVDDDPVIGRSFDRVLSNKGYVVITAADGQEALSKLAGEDYDVIFTDIRMPGMDGVELAGRVKARRPWVPVVIITGYGTADNETRAKEAGVAAFLRKPLSPEMIEGSASKALLENEAIAVALEAPAAVAVPLPAAAEKETAAPEIGRFASHVALLIAAPFVGLAYIIAFPFAGLAWLAWTGTRELMKRLVAWKVARFAKNVALFVAAPFVGLAYVIAFPFVGLATLAWMGARAWMKRNRAQ